MKVLFIGGTGTISTAISRKLLLEGHELWLINRGSRNNILPEGNLHLLTADINDEAAVASLIQNETFDVVADFIVFHPEQLERDYRLFRGKTRQFIYISSASAYHKPCSSYIINEGTALSNPYWEYSRNKIAGEELLMKLYREDGFPVTIVRPSHTYDERRLPIGVKGKNGSYQVLKRMMEGKRVIIHGDGTSLWTVTMNRDFANAFVGLMGNIHAIGEAVQITGDESLTWNQIYQTAADILGVELKPCYVSTQFLAAAGKGKYDFKGELWGDKSNTVVFDNSKLKRLVPDFVPAIPFHQGARETISYMFSHPECQKEDPEFDIWCDRVIRLWDEAVEKMQNFE